MAKRLAAAILTLALAATAGPAWGAETDIRFKVSGTEVVGTLETPDGAESAPVVLLLHGFTGSRHELPVKDTEEGVFSRTARKLAEAGYASLRIDFRGSGESGGAWEDTTFSGQIADAIAAIDWLADADGVDGQRIAVLGWSQGGLIAAHAAAARPQVKTAMLWAPVVHPIHTFSAILGADTYATALESPADMVITAKLPWGPETKLKAAFFQEFARTSTAAAVARYSGPLKVIVGGRDTVVAPQPASGQILMDYHEGREALTVFDTDHVWDAFSGPDVIDSKMVPATLDWLAEHL